MIPASSGYEWLAVAGLVRDPHVLQISWKPLAHLLLHNIQDQIARIFGDKLARHDHFQEAAELPDCAVAEIDNRVLDGVTKCLLNLGGAVAKWEVGCLISARTLMTGIK
jgi:hypothetical protein